MSDFGHQLLLASAGTGKTWQLSNRFLALLFAGVTPASILATTFTRKAASEILDRVLERLVEAIERPEKLAELREALGRSDLAAAGCLELLGSLTRGLDTFQVRTIDSFFVHLMRLFALDLELPPEWRIARERERGDLQTAALQDVLEENPSEEMLELLRALHQGGMRRRVQGGMLELVHDLRPILLESTPEAWARVEAGEDVAEAELRDALGELPGAPVPLTKSGEPNKNWVKARSAAVELCAAQDWEAFLSAGLGAAYLGGESPETRTYYRTPLPEGLDCVLAPIVAHAKHAFLSELRARNLATRSLLERFEQAYTARQRSRGAYHFEDLPIVLAPRTSAGLPIDERELDLWFRLDGRIDHLLLDEFQDTAPVQWRILASIAEEITADGTGERSFFCVGDVKQSIYAFRQAEPRLLAEMERILPQVETRRLLRSYRSSKVVLEAVNRIFTDLEGNAAFGGDGLDPYREAARAWSAGFAEHVSARPELSGSALVLEARPKGEDEEPFEPLLELCEERVLRIRSEVPGAKIAVLMRENKRIPPLIHRLRRRGIDASGEGGGALVDSEAVLCFLSLLHLADHPEDGAAAFHVASSRFGDRVGLAVDAGDERRRSFARDWRARLVNEGLGAVTRELAATVTAENGWPAWDVARFAQLLDLAYAFEGELGLRPSRFVEHVHRERVEAPGGARVRVMTIHAAKGLEFDAVVLPELGGSLVGRRPLLALDRPKPEGRIQTVTRAPRKELVGTDPELGRLYDATTSRMVEDSLSNLYVALTRAARKLEVIVPWVDPDRDERSSSPAAADLVRAALPPGECHERDEEGAIWRHPENPSGAEWGAGIEEPPSESPAARPRALDLAASRRPRALPRRSPSGEEGGGAVRVASLLAGRRAAHLGSLVHSWLEELRWIEDFELDEARLAGTPRARAASPDVVEEALSLLRSALEADAVRAALSREECGAPPDSSREVRNEHAFSTVLRGGAGEAGGGADEDQLWTGSIDRLVLATRGGRVVWAEILDYKTDSIDTDEALAGRIAHYRPQLESYRIVVAAQTKLAPESIEARLVFLALGRVVDL